MYRKPWRMAALAVLAVSVSHTMARAEDPGKYMGYYAFQAPGQPEMLNGEPIGGPGYGANPVSPGYGYPQLHAPLYPCPRPDVPVEVGGSIITNAALYPQEMLWAHKYKAVYPPYFYKTTYKYGYKLTCWPAGKWYAVPVLKRVAVPIHTKMRGTVVEVEYCSHISPFSLFFAPTGEVGGCKRRL